MAAWSVQPAVFVTALATASECKQRCGPLMSRFGTSRLGLPAKFPRSAPRRLLLLPDPQRASAGMLRSQAGAVGAEGVPWRTIRRVELFDARWSATWVVAGGARPAVWEIWCQFEQPPLHSVCSEDLLSQTNLRRRRAPMHLPCENAG
jgi:hypothetical protein